MATLALGRALQHPQPGTAADRGSPATEIRDVDMPGLSGHAAAWDRLAATASAPTPFFTRAFIAAHLAHRITAVPRMMTAWRGGELVAALPYRGRVRFGWTARARVAWASPFVTSSTPLVAAEGIEDAIGLLLDGMASAGPLWLLPRLTLDDAVGAAVLREVERRGWPWRVLQRYDRPVLDRRASHDVFLAGLGANRRKDLARRRRRLGEQGRVEFRAETAGAALAAAVDSFLDLERAGWKGRRGTALASRPDHAAFARDLFGGGPGPVSARADLLLLDGRPVAASLALVAGRTAYLLKTAYDEALARFAPGLLLEAEIVRALHEDAFADRLNSATTAETPLADIYPDREAVGDVVFACGAGASRAALDRLVAREEVLRDFRRRAKDFLRHLRDRASATR